MLFLDWDWEEEPSEGLALAAALLSDDDDIVWCGAICAGEIYSNFENKYLFTFFNVDSSPYQSITRSPANNANISFATRYSQPFVYSLLAKGA